VRETEERSIKKGGSLQFSVMLQQKMFYDILDIALQAIDVIFSKRCQN
jgi:hypothetical protein